MKYQVIEARTALELAEEVQKALSHGWALQGGVSVSAVSSHDARDDYWETTWTYAQAVTRASP